MIKYRSWKENFAFAFCKIVFCVLKHLQRSRWYRRSQFVILFRQYFISMKVLRAFKGNNLVSILQPQWLAHLKTSPRHTKYWQECLLKSSSCGTLLQRGHFKNQRTYVQIQPSGILIILGWNEGKKEIEAGTQCHCMFQVTWLFLTVFSAQCT